MSYGPVQCNPGRHDAADLIIGARFAGTRPYSLLQELVAKSFSNGSQGTACITG